MSIGSDIHVVFCIGENDNDATLVSIEILKKTDIIGFTKKPDNYILPFYMSSNIDCGKVITITDLSGNVVYKETTLSTCTGQQFTVKHDQYFLIEESLLTVYPYKCTALLKATTYINQKYTGALYKHYNGGYIKNKIRYVNGKIIFLEHFRNDALNTKKYSVQYKSEYPMVAYLYDNKETTIGHVFLTTKLKAHSKSSNITDDMIKELIALLKTEHTCHNTEPH